MRRKIWLIIGLIVLIVVGGLGYIVYSGLLGNIFDQVLFMGEDEYSFDNLDELEGLGGFGQAIRPASEIVQIQATGNIELQEQEALVSTIEALTSKVHVKVGDSVTQGEPLVEFDTSKLEREVEEARYNLIKAQSELKKLLKPPESHKVTAAEQKVLMARKELQTVQTGPTALELQVAETESFVAWAKYNELTAGKTDDELAQQRIALRQSERKLQRAQEAYDSVSWRSNFELTETNARALEEATDAYETAKASYNQATKPTTEKDLREQHSAALQAQEKLNKLRKKPNKKEITEAVLKLLDAENELKTLTNGPDSDKTAEMKMEIQQKVLLLVDTETKLTNAKLVAPFAGTVVKVDAQAGKTAEVNSKMVTIANLQAFKLTVNVPEAKINRLHLEQPVAVSLDALPDRTFSGKVSYISPISNKSEGGGTVSYAVTIQLDLNQTEGIRAGMTAVVSFLDQSMENAWLVPTTAIQQDGEEASVTVYRGDEMLTIQVKPDIKRGEWTVVHAPDLQAGDEIEATFSSFLDGGGMFGEGAEFQEESY